MAVTALGSLAARAPAAVYAAVGRNALSRVEDLSLHPRIDLASSPRHAGVLLVAGELRDDDGPALRRLHDQLPHPRATVWWGAEPDPLFPHPAVVAAGDDPASRITESHRDLLTGLLTSEPDILPDEPPVPWRGRGDHGQGGQGMMGGVPYGRPMPMSGEDLRDGLALDSYQATFGPFLPMLPPGLVLDITLQGDVVQQADVSRPPFEQGEDQDAAARLRRLARLLRVLGLEAHADQLLRVAQMRAQGVGDDGAVSGWLRWSGALQAIPPDLGRVGDGSDVRHRLGRWCADADEEDDGGDADVRLVDLLLGLEWNEAVLVINSFAPATLRRMCAPGAELGESGG